MQQAQEVILLEGLKPVYACSVYNDGKGAAIAEAEESFCVSGAFYPFAFGS